MKTGITGKKVFFNCSKDEINQAMHLPRAGGHNVCFMAFTNSLGCGLAWCCCCVRDDDGGLIAQGICTGLKERGKVASIILYHCIALHGVCMFEAVI